MPDFIDTCRNLADAVTTHCENGGELDNPQFDAMLLRFGVVDSIPAVSSRERGGFTRSRDEWRRHVNTELTTRGKSLKLRQRNVPRRGAIYSVEDIFDARRAAVGQLPHRYDKHAKRVIRSLQKALDNEMSVIAREIPAEVVATLMPSLMRRLTRLFDQMQDDIDTFTPSAGNRPPPYPPRPMLRRRTSLPMLNGGAK